MFILICLSIICFLFCGIDIYILSWAIRFFFVFFFIQSRSSFDLVKKKLLHPHPSLSDNISLYFKCNLYENDKWHFGLNLLKTSLHVFSRISEETFIVDVCIWCSIIVPVILLHSKHDLYKFKYYIFT